ncbi:MAG: hypothetical protein ACI94Y_003828 [Maribacter sp.]|jgi:hypothetical protein
MGFNPLLTQQGIKILWIIFVLAVQWVMTHWNELENIFCPVLMTDE